MIVEYCSADGGRPFPRIMVTFVDDNNDLQIASQQARKYVDELDELDGQMSRSDLKIIIIINVLFLFVSVDSSLTQNWAPEFR